VCDIACEYCFYLEKHALFGRGENYRMSDIAGHTAEAARPPHQLQGSRAESLASHQRFVRPPWQLTPAGSAKVFTFRIYVNSH
jgi:hypothetical protein